MLSHLCFEKPGLSFTISTAKENNFLSISSSNIFELNSKSGTLHHQSQFNNPSIFLLTETQIIPQISTKTSSFNYELSGAYLCNILSWTSVLHLPCERTDLIWVWNLVTIMFIITKTRLQMTAGKSFVVSNDLTNIFHEPIIILRLSSVSYNSLHLFLTTRLEHFQFSLLRCSNHAHISYPLCYNWCANIKS